jgi:hypothetical protein
MNMKLKLFTIAPPLLRSLLSHSYQLLLWLFPIGHKHLDHAVDPLAILKLRYGFRITALKVSVYFRYELLPLKLDDIS